MTILRIIDFETTGMEPPAEVVEVGYCDHYIDVPATRAEAGELSLSAAAIGEALAEALWRDDRLGGTALDNLDFAAEALDDHRHAIISAPARLRHHLHSLALKPLPSDSRAADEVRAAMNKERDQ